MAEHPVMAALKGAITQGTKFKLTQQMTGPDSPHTVLLEVSGGVSCVTLKLPFNWVCCDGEAPIASFTWESNSYTAGLFVSAVDGMPDNAAPELLLNTSLWDGGGLLLTGAWEVKKGRAKEGKPEFRNFLLDAGVYAASV